MLLSRDLSSLAVLYLLAAVGSPSPLRAEAAPPAASVLLRPDQVWDGVADSPRAGVVVLVTGNRIAAVGSASAVRVPTDARVIDLPGVTLLPGLIDAHSHIFLHPYDETLWNDQVLKEPLAYRTIAAEARRKRKPWQFLAASASRRVAPTPAGTYLIQAKNLPQRVCGGTSWSQRSSERWSAWRSHRFRP
jgi:imidazolonepropionase-like amidohydrolase